MEVTPTLLRQPELDVSLSVFLEQLALSLATNGNAYTRIDRDSSGRPVNLTVLDPLTV